jgi:hypothetical protein
VLKPNNCYNRVPRGGTLVCKRWRYSCNFIIDEGVQATRARPLGIGFQERVSNRHKLFGSRVPVVNIVEKRRQDQLLVSWDDERMELTIECCKVV